MPYLTSAELCLHSRISIRNIDLITTRLENDLEIGHCNTICKFHEAISPFRMKTRSFNFAIFLWPPNFLRFDVFQRRISVTNIDQITTKLENDLEIGHHNTTFKFHEDISPFRIKMRSFNFAIFYGGRTN